jgi:putative ABC transport system permease protein
MIRLIKGAARMAAPLGIPLAWRQLVDDRKRMAAAIMGITFGIMLMLFQLGLYNGIMAMVVLPHHILRGELVMVSPNYEYFGSSMEFSRRRLLQARSLPEVESTAPLYLGFLQWANPVNGSIKMIFAMAIDPDQNPFVIPEIANHVDAIRDPESVLFDTLSQEDYGPVPALFRDRGVVETEAERKRVRVTGLFTLGHTLAASAVVVMSDEAYFRIRPDKPRNMANVGMIVLKAGADPDAVARRLRRILPGDVEIVRREEFMKAEQDYWAKRTPIGFVSAAGMLVGMLVGGIVVYQILYTDVNDHLRQYATLKAIGLADSFFVMLVLQEALLLMLLGFIPAALLTAVLNHEARVMAHIPTSLSVGDLVIVLTAVAAVCLIAGVLATRRLRTADPADVF